MKLSVIIVNYNVKFFLEQCLFSVLKALQDIPGEVIVVDNCSVDGSEAMVENRFPQVKLLINQQNVGFAKANNQAIKIAQGEYILLLNPDTVVEESTFKKCIGFMDQHPDAGILGPKMIDGKGNFLPESKRGLPTPMVSFWKIFGFTRIFPHSPLFARYYLGHTSIDQTQQVDVLTGAFMFIRKSIVNKVGYLDESFFMYGEDIDFSHRVSLAGFKNYYFPEVSIIHYKGESTKRGSLNYVMVFYKAMQIFVKKHFTGNQARIFSTLIFAAIYFRATLSLIKRSLSKVFTFLIDGVFMYLGFYLVAIWWAGFYFHDPNYYPPQFKYLFIPGYVLVLLVSGLLAGSYRAPFNLWRIAKGLFIGSIIILVAYSLLPYQFRFSRAVILLGLALATFISFLIRVLLNLTGSRQFLMDGKANRRIAIVGSANECQRVQLLLKHSGVKASNLVWVFHQQAIPAEMFIGNITQLPEVINVHKIDEIIFCAKDISSQEIIKNMKMLKSGPLNFKIASPNSQSVIGSNSSSTAGDLYVIKADAD